MCLAILTLVAAYMLNRKIRLPFDISYGVYLYHMVIVNILVQLGMTGSYKGFWIAIVGSIMCGFLSWHLIEKRCLRWGREFGNEGRK